MRREKQAVQEAKDPKSTESAGGTTGAPESREPDSAATSSDTLNDIEETEKVPSASGQERGGSSSSTPSPDGAFDEGGGRGPREDPGPM
jgi:hypothetical protein